MEDILVCVLLLLLLHHITIICTQDPSTFLTLLMILQHYNVIGECDFYATPNKIPCTL